MLNLETGFSIYPRGFVGAALNTDANRHATSVDKLAAIIKSGGAPPPEYHLPHNREVARLARLVLARSPETRTISFRKDALKAALLAFGTSSIEHWYIAQSKSEHFGDTHRRFIDDSLRFIGGEGREYDPIVWQQILPVDQKQQISDALKPRAYFEQIQSPLAIGHFKKWPTSIQDTVQLWASREDGFEDMIFSLGLMFGA